MNDSEVLIEIESSFRAENCARKDKKFKSKCSIMQLWGKIVYQDCTLQLCCNALLWWRVSLSQHLKTKNTKTFYCLFKLGDHSIPSYVIIKVLITKIEKHTPKSKVIKGRWGKFCSQILCWPNHTLVSKFSQCSAAAFSAALQGQSCSV